MKAILPVLTLLWSGLGSPQDGGHKGGPAPRSECIPAGQYQAIKDHFSKTPPSRISDHQKQILYADPMGNGGMNAFGNTITNYVDLAARSGRLDHNCGTVTYDGHQGTDIEILNFYEMDENVPILCAAPGVVIYVHDGEYDRNTEWQAGAVANAVIVSHADSSEAWYWHMKKQSVRVSVGDRVDVGDTLGCVGSSGYSSGPHLHFEIQHHGTCDPFQGACQPDPSRWMNQGDYVLSLPFELMDHGLTTIPLSWAMISERPPAKTHVTAPGPIYSWLRLRNALASDVLMWEFYANGSLWVSYSFSPGTTYSSSWWYIWWPLPSAPVFYGEWALKIYRNGLLMAEQNFTYDDQANQLPTIENLIFNVSNNDSLAGEFLAHDAEGSIFLYEIASFPDNGALSQFGGRRRKFRYTPHEGYVGKDTVVFRALDDEFAAGQNGMYVFDVAGSASIAEPVDSVPHEFYLSQNHPNPFNPATTIRYGLMESAHVTLSVYNLFGQEVRTLVNAVQTPGHKSVQWDGRNDYGQNVSSGIYIYRLQTPEFVNRKRLLLLR